MSVFEVESADLDNLASYIEQYSGNAGRAIDEILHGIGAETIKERIAPLIPESGRSWSGKAAPAASAMPGKFSQDNESMAVTIAARGRYGYLYFPDDGSNTLHHAGGQHFMEAGGQDAMSEVIELLVGKLTEEF